MMYKELTREQKNIRSRIWVRVLDEFCPPIFEDGTRPCDLGSMCDRCQLLTDDELEG